MEGLFGGLFGDVGGLLSFASHPVESIMLFIGGIILMVIVYKIIVS
jgi:hypothetical protein